MDRKNAGNVDFKKLEVGVFNSERSRLVHQHAVEEESNVVNSDLSKLVIRYTLHTTVMSFLILFTQSRNENPQKLTQLSSRSHPRHLVGKRTAQKDITIDTTSNSQVNSNFPNRWSPASLTFNNYFYLFLYYI